MLREHQPSPLQVHCVDPEKCKNCPPDRVCAWACEQGWSEWDINLMRDWMAETGELRMESRDVHDSPFSDLDSPPSPDSQALMESFG